MQELLNALSTPIFLTALLGCLLIGVSSGIVGSFVVVKRISYIAGAISHCVLGGMGLFLYLNKVHHYTFLTPLAGAFAAAILSAVLIGFVSLRAKQREDTIISIVWASGMAVGLLFMAITPGYNQDLMSYLFGNILLISANDLISIAVLDFIVILFSILFYNKLFSVCFDEEFARVRGLKVEFYYILLLCLTAITVVLLITVVGIIMVIALLTIPVAISGQFVKTLKMTMILSVILSIILSAAGIIISYPFDLPPGPIIIVLSAAIYLLVLISKKIFQQE